VKTPRVGKPKRKTPSSASRTKGDLTRLLRDERSVLLASVMAGGLCDVRPRSIPERVRLEAGRFLDTLLFALRLRKSQRALEARIREEVRSGAFAAASIDDVGSIVDTWRRTLSAFAASHSRALQWERFDRVLGELETMVTDEARRWIEDRIDVIVMGASTGGIQALSAILRELRADLPATVLIVQHISATSPSVMPRVLSRECDMTVVHAVEGARLLLGCVYVAPPAKHLVVADGRLHLADGPPVRYTKPAADVLFESAAKTYGRHVASIVLSGNDSDGADGSRAVRDAGGLTIAQHPGTARVPSMPEAAIATGAVELVVALPLMGSVIERLVRHGRSSLRESKWQEM
jgi:two-component system, chemotaxis family, protein-glutamate methylesterase/glutaminase